jgi:hypothetical protein
MYPTDVLPSKTWIIKPRSLKYRKLKPASIACQKHNLLETVKGDGCRQCGQKHHSLLHIEKENKDRPPHKPKEDSGSAAK